ncbi:hypothetical protein Tco_0213786 [Tanacetum coccineum]
MKNNRYNIKKMMYLMRTSGPLLKGTMKRMVNLLKDLNGVTETLKVVQDAFKDDPALNKKVIEATEAYTKNSSTLTELLSLANTEEPPSHTEGEHVAMKDDTKKPESDKAEEEPTRAVPISTISPLTDPILEILVPQREGKAIATDDQPDIQTKLVPASKEVRPDPDAPILVPYEINGKNF